MQPNEWGLLPMVEFGPPGDPARNVAVYFLRDTDNLYLAFVIGDPTADLLTDSLKVYFDATDNAGDPDSTDRFFQITRDGTLLVRAGLGTNIDGLDWDSNYTSNNWTAEVGEPGGNSWVVEMVIEASAEVPIMLDGNPFGMMAQVLYTGLQQNWPETAVTNNAGSWQEVTNTTCP
jgi:hypothetical protein